MVFGIKRRTIGLLFALGGTFSPAQSNLQPYRVLHDFQGGNDGSRPVASLVRDPSGNLYGTTSIGGNTNCPSGCGVVFKVSATGQETIFYSFHGGTDGALPYAGLIRDASGNLYGTTDEGGGCAFIDGCGTVFELSPAGQETVLYRFQDGTDGGFPFTSLVRDSAGNLYGTTISGGDFLYGTIFVVTPTGHESVLYSFTGGADGIGPAGSLVRDASGNLYGTTSQGGTYGVGTVFELTAGGALKVLHSFNTDGKDGQNSWAGLVRDGSGNLFGTTLLGGIYGSGTVFEVSSSGQEKVLHSFSGGPDGGLPLGNLILDASGNLYGTTQEASDGGGVVFKMDAMGHETVLHAFGQTGASDGGTPQAGLVRDTAGNLYGTTEFGGTFNSGIVFKLAP